MKKSKLKNWKALRFPKVHVATLDKSNPLDEVKAKMPPEFFLQLDDGLYERFWQEVSDYLSNADEKTASMILKSYERWKREHPWERR